MGDTSIREFIVSNGSQRRRTQARSPFLAAVQRIKLASFKRLGLLMTVTEKKASMKYYLSTERVCRAAKMWRGK